MMKRINKRLVISLLLATLFIGGLIDSPRQAVYSSYQTPKTQQTAPEQSNTAVAPPMSTAPIVTSAPPTVASLSPVPTVCSSASQAADDGFYKDGINTYTSIYNATVMGVDPVTESSIIAQANQTYNTGMKQAYDQYLAISSKWGCKVQLPVPTYK